LSTVLEEAQEGEEGQEEVGEEEMTVVRQTLLHGTTSTNHTHSAARGVDMINATHQPT
jgi:hypothetical protein